MAKISLRMYNREIEGLIEQGQRLDEAIAHCRHILKTYPKHLETYRLLGKAYLEAKRYDQAVDIFQRVLVAAPDDFVSHVGMSIIADDKGRLDDAIWHMERAFEVQPSNAAIQGELQRLFGRRDGVEPPKIRLTRGALAHMYVQGELYNQAISEIRAVLGGDPKRTDMQTLLARAYFRNGQKTEATEICTELLSKYPYCLDANRLMVDIIQGTQHAETAQDYRQRVIELDPYAAFAQDSVFHADGVADNQVTLDRLEYTGQAAEMPPSLGIGLDTDATMVSRAAAEPQIGRPSGDLPSWLKGGADDAGAAPASEPAPATDKDDIPGFLRQAGWGTATAGSVEEAPAQQPVDSAPTENAAVEGELPEWVKALAPTNEDLTSSNPPAAGSDLFPSGGGSSQQPPSMDTPDWLRSLGQDEPAAVAPPPPPTPQTPQVPPAMQTPRADVPDWLRDLGPAAPTDAATSAAAPDEAPDWLKDLGGRELDEPAPPVKNESEADWLGGLREGQDALGTAQPAQDESPEWLKDFSNDLETPISKAAAPEPPAPVAAAPDTSAGLGSLGTTAQEQDDAMAWLEGLAAKHGAKPEELVTDPNARTEVAPDWVDKAKEIGEPTEATSKPAGDDQTGIWLRQLEDDTQRVSEPKAAQSPSEEFDFRREFADLGGTGTPAQPAAGEEPAAAALGETPDWLNEFSPKPLDRSSIDDAPDWLRGMSGEEPEAEQPVVKMPADVSTAPTPSLPSTDRSQGEEGIGDLPAWLAGLEQEEQPSQPAPQVHPSEDLPSWLQAEIEPEPEPEVKEPANPADWRPVTPEPVRPPEPKQEPKPEPKPEPAMQQATPPPAPPEPKVVVKATPAAPIPARPKPASAPVKTAVISLTDAQTQLGRGNIAAALDIYSKLIRKGKSLEDIIRDLRDALYRYPVEVPLWQSLGDAYMRANRLQEALDAYTKAEELLR